MNWPLAISQIEWKAQNFESQAPRPGFHSRQRKKYTPTEIGSHSKFYRELFNSTDHTSNWMWHNSDSMK